MKKQAYSDKQVRLACYAKALGHPARIAIMEFLTKQNICSFSEIHEQLPIAKTTTLQHLSELKDAGLIQSKTISSKVRYRINQRNLKEAKLFFGEFFEQHYDRKPKPRGIMAFLRHIFVFRRITNKY